MSECLHLHLQLPVMSLLSLAGGVTCTTDFVDSHSFPGSEWQLTVHTPWPGAEIHTRPYPVTLVNWDTVMRVMGLGSSAALEALATFLGVVEVQMILQPGIGEMLLYASKSNLSQIGQMFSWKISA